MLVVQGNGAAAFETQAQRAILIDDVTGTVIFEKNADDLMPPASMSKLMTAYMLFERLGTGRLSLEDTFPVSEKAWRMGGSKMFVEVGKRVSVEDLLRGIIVQSGNDATIVVAEGLAGSEDAFAAEMTKRADQIGMTRSVFKNASGWPQEGHVMTARDLALLARRTIHEFPEFYGYYKQEKFTFNDISQANRNPLLGKSLGVDGLKTGHTSEAGYGLTVSAKRGDRRLILVVAGLDSSKRRATEAERLLEYGFQDFSNYVLFKAGEKVIDADVWLGESVNVPMLIEDKLVLTLSYENRRNMTVKVVYDSPIPAPISAGTTVAKLVVEIPNALDLEVPLVVGDSVAGLTMFRRWSAALDYLLWGSAAPRR